MADADQLHGRAIIAIQDMRDEIERLRAEVAEWKRVASAQAELHDTAERELAELRERIENGVVADVAEDTRHEGSSALVAAAEKVGYYEGHRVRLVREDDT